jgi:hypothetical protein
MNRNYLVQPCWTLVTPLLTLTSAMNLALLKKVQPLALLDHGLTEMTTRGAYGCSSAWTSTQTRSSLMSMIPYPSCKYSLTDIAKESWLPVGIKSAHAPWRAPFVPWARRSLHWATETLGYCLQGN